MNEPEWIKFEYSRSWMSLNFLNFHEFSWFFKKIFLNFEKTSPKKCNFRWMTIEENYETKIDFKSY